MALIGKAVMDLVAPALPLTRVFGLDMLQVGLACKSLASELPNFAWVVRVVDEDSATFLVEKVVREFVLPDSFEVEAHKGQPMLEVRADVRIKTDADAHAKAAWAMDVFLLKPKPDYIGKKKVPIRRGPIPGELALVAPGRKSGKGGSKGGNKDKAPNKRPPRTWAISSGP